MKKYHLTDYLMREADTKEVESTACKGQKCSTAKHKSQSMLLQPQIMPFDMLTPLTVKHDEYAKEFTRAKALDFNDSLDFSRMTQCKNEICACGYSLSFELLQSTQFLKRRMSILSTQHIFQYFFQNRRTYTPQQMRQKLRRFLLSQSIVFKIQEIQKTILQIYSRSHICCHHRFGHYLSKFTQTNGFKNSWDQLQLQCQDIDKIFITLFVDLEPWLHESLRSSLDGMDLGHKISYWDLMLYLVGELRNLYS